MSAFHSRLSSSFRLILSFCILLGVLFGNAFCSPSSLLQAASPPKNDTQFINGFLFGYVTSTRNDRAEIAIGFADRVKRHQRVAVFRYKKGKLTVLDAVRLEIMNEIRSSGSILGGTKLRVGDIVAVPQKMLVPVTSGGSVEDYTSRSILNHRSRASRYSTINDAEVARKTLAQKDRLREVKAVQYENEFLKNEPVSSYDRAKNRLKKQPYTPRKAESKVFLEMTQQIRKYKAYTITNKRAPYEMTIGQKSAISALGNIRAIHPKVVEIPKEESDDAN